MLDQQGNQEQPKNNFDNPDTATVLYLKKNGTYYKIGPDEILFVQADKDFTIVYTKERTFFNSTRLAEMERLLHPFHFLKVHRSYIINPNKVAAVDATNLLIFMSNFEIPISRRMKKQVLQVLALG